MELSALRATELQFRVEAMSADLEAWRHRAAHDLPLQQSQIFRATGEIEAFLKTQMSEVPTEPFAANDFRFASIVYASYVWAYYRSKFAQRSDLDPNLRFSLKCADEVAWECYEPARACAIAQETIRADMLKEPPLTYFGSYASPYIWGRGKFAWLDGMKESTQAGDALSEIDSTLESMVMPVIAIPWYEAGHVPGLVLLAHEVGHAVEIDFALAPEFTRAIEAADQISPEHKLAWHAWQSELFADTYGVLCAGPAFVATLMERLTAPQRDIEAEVPSSSSAYPPRHLRIAFNLAAMRHLGLETEVERLEQAWLNTYNPPAAQGTTEGFRRDLPRIAAAFLETGTPMFGNRGIRSVVDVSPDSWLAVTASAERLRASEDGRFNLGDPAGESALYRHWAAAAAWAWHVDAERYTHLQEGFLEVLARARPERAREDAGSGIRSLHETRAAATGQVLSERFKTLMR